MKNDLCKSALPRLRDKDWVLTGKVPKIEFENKLAKKNTYPHEIEQAKRLSQHGIKCTFQVDYEVVDKKGTVIGKTDLNNGIELKSLSNAKNLRGRIDKGLKNARKKKGFKCCNFDAYGTNFSNREITSALAKEMKLRGVREASFIDSEGAYHKLTT